MNQVDRSTSEGKSVILFCENNKKASILDALFCDGGGWLTMDSEMLQEMLMETSVTFQDVCGYSDVKDCLNAYTYDLNQASVRGKQLPSPILLFGHPGVGKTRLLQAAASEANSKLLVFSPYMMTGRLFPKSFTESIKAVFTVARDNSPCILCFEDVSVWSNERNRGEAGEEFVTQLLAQYQEASLDKKEVALVMTSVNPWHLKLSSINKFKPVHVDLPPQETRIDLMKLCLKDISYDFGDEVFSVLAERTSGFTGADISCLVKDASMEAIRKITKATFFKKILVPEQKKDREKKGEKSCMKDQKFEGKATSSVCESETRSVRGELAATAAAEERARLIDSEHSRSEILTEKFVPCQETDEGAIQVSFWDLESEMIHCPDSQLTREEIMATLARKKPTVAKREIDLMTEFTTRFCR